MSSVHLEKDNLIFPKDIKNSHLDEGVSSEKKYSIVLLILGVLANLGGVFIILAACQILPCGLNAICSLGVGGYILGCGLMGIGLLAIVLYITRCSKADSQQAENTKTEHSSLPEEMQILLNQLLQKTEFKIETLPINRELLKLEKNGDFIVPESHEMEGYLARCSLPDGRNAIAIKMRSTISRRDYFEKRKMEDWKKWMRLMDKALLSENPECVFILAESSESPLCWFTPEAPSPCYPEFLKGTFTSAKNGSILPDQNSDFLSLQKLFAGEAVADRAGIQWQLATNTEVKLQPKNKKKSIFNSLRNTIQTIRLRPKTKKTEPPSI